jgi:hypothetical protein
LLRQIALSLGFTDLAALRSIALNFGLAKKKQLLFLCKQQFISSIELEDNLMTETSDLNAYGRFSRDVNTGIADRARRVGRYIREGGVAGHIGGQNGQPNAYGQLNSDVTDAVGDTFKKVGRYIKEGGVVGHLGGQDGQPNAYGQLNSDAVDAVGDTFKKAGAYVRDGGVLGHI